MYSQVPREPGSRVFLTSRVPALDFSRGLPDVPDTGGQRNLPRNTCSEGSTSGPVAPSRGASSRPGSISSRGKGRTCLGLANQPVLCQFQEAPTRDPASPLLLPVPGRMSSGSLRQTEPIGHALPVRGPEHLSLNLSLTAHLLCDFRHATAPL